jgi:hypothetical protein
MGLSLMVLGLLGIALGLLANAQAVSTTTVQGTVYLANGQAGAGTLMVSWPAFTTANGQAVAADSTTVTIAPDGFVSVNLAPNQGATPAGLYYTAIFYLSDGTVNTQYWVVPAAAQASLAQVQAQLMPAVQAVQAVSKQYVDQSIAALSDSLLEASGGTMTGPLYLSGDPIQELQAADKHYVDESLALAVPLAGGTMTGALATPAVNGVQAPVAGSPNTSLQAAMNAAGSNGAMEIPPTYAGTDRFTNPNGIYVADLRRKGSQQFERSVKEFGAVCDGTTDDTNALQAAINYAEAHGVALTIPQGTCKTRTLSWHGESIGGMGKQVSALMGFPGQDVLASATDSMNLLSSTRLHDLTIYVDQSMDVSCTPAEGRAPAGSCAVNRPMENNSIFSPGGNGLTGTAGTGAAWAVGNCAIAMPAATGAGGNGLRVAEIENVEIAATGTDPMAATYTGAHSTHTCGLYLGQWPQWSEFRNIDIRGLNTGIAIPALAGTAPAGLNADSNHWQNITIQATHAFTAAAGSNNVLDNVVAMAGNSAATGEPPTGLVLDLTGTQQGWTARNAVVMPAWNAVQPQLMVAASGGAVTGVTVGTEHGLGFDPYGTQVPLKFSGSCTAQATAAVNSNGSIGTVTVTAGGAGCSGTTTASVNVSGTWDTAAPVNLIGGQNMTLLSGNLLKGSGGYTVWNAANSQGNGTQMGGGGGTLPCGGNYAGLVANSPLGATSQADQFPGADFGAKVQACVNALSASYGGTCDARNFTGTQSMGSNLTISTANVTVLLPCATIATANQVVVTAGTRNVSLRGCALRGASTASGSEGGTVFLYSGSGAMVLVGDPAYAADTMGFHMDNAVINTTASNSSTAQGLVAYRTQEMDVDSLYLLGNSNQTGMTLDGTGNYTGGSFFNDHFNGFQTAVNAVGHKISNPATTDWMNASTFVRLHIDCPTSGGSPISGTYGINLQQGDGNTFTGGDVEGCSTALHLGANAQNNTIVGLRNENSTNQVVADTGSSYNNWMTGGTMFTGQLTDNGTRNSFLDTFHRSFNGMNGDWYGSQKDATVTNHYRIGIGTGNERGLLNRYQTDSGYRWTMGLSDATAGEQFYQILDELNNVYRLSIGQYNNGQSSTNNQTVINAAGTGAIVLNGSNNSGTGGVVFGSGGANETTVATINSAGNAQFTGTLQVGGTSTFIGTPTVRNQANAEIDAVLQAGNSASQKESFIYNDYNGASQWYMVKDQYNNWALNSATGGLDSFKAYQSTNSGDTYINASNPSGVVRINYETGAGTGLKVYGGNNSSLYASFTAPNAIMFPGLAASSGPYCLQIDDSGYVSNTGSACGSGSGGSGGGSGTVMQGSTGQIAYYTLNGAEVGGMNMVPVAAGGTGASTAAAALANLGGVAMAGAAFTGAISAPSTNGVQTVPAGGNIQAAITAAGAGGTVNLTPRTTYTVSGNPGLTISQPNLTFNFNGACIVTTGTGDGIYIQTTGATVDNVVINSPCLIPGAASTGASIHDVSGIGTTINNASWLQQTGHNPAGGYYWHYLFQVDGNEQFVINQANSNFAVLECDTTFCGDVLYNTPGLGNGSAAVVYMNNSSFNLENSGNGIEWEAYGNDIHLSGVVIENTSQFMIRSLGNVLCDKCHLEDSGSSINPALNGIHSVAEVIMNGGQFHGTDGIFEGAPAVFSATGTTGTTVWQYWVIAKSATYGDTAPMPFGMVNNGTASWSGLSASLTFPSFIPTGSDTITCSILRTTGLSAAPYPNDGVADVVATGQSCSTGTYWTYTDSVATASLGTYSFAPDIFNGFFPTIANWSGAVILSGRNVNSNATEGSYSGACWPGTNFVTTRNYGVINYPQVTCTGSTYPYFGVSISYSPVQMQTIDSWGTYLQHALMLQNRYGPYTSSAIKGVLNLGATTGDADILTLVDSNPYKTMATVQNRPAADAGDAALGTDGSGNMAFRSPGAISLYIDSLLDGTSWLEHLTSSAKTFTVPVTAPSFIGSLTGNASTATNVPYSGLTGTVPTWNQNTTGNAATASALATTPTQCTGGQFATGIAANGNANCATSGGGSGTTATASTVPGDLICAKAGDTTVYNVPITGGSCSGSSCAINVNTGNSRIYQVPGQIFGIAGNSTARLNGGPYTLTSSTGLLMTFPQTASSGTVSSGGDVFLWCENQAADATTATAFSKNTIPVPANTMVAGTPLNHRAQLSFVSSSTPPGLTPTQVFIGSTPVLATAGPSAIDGGMAFRMGEIGFDLVPLTVGSSGLITASWLGIPSLPMSYQSTAYWYNINTPNPTMINTTNSNVVSLSTAYTATGLGSITASSGCTVTGSTGQTVLLTSFNNGNTTATATGTLIAANTISGATWVVTNTGQAATAAATSATCGNGTATASGTATLTTTLGGAQGNAVMLVSLQ